MSLHSDWSDSDSDSLDLTDFSTSAPAMEDVPPDIRKLVCETCWSTVFSVESFRIAWEALPENFYSRSAGFSYTTPTWGQIQRQQRRHLIEFRHRCEWCKIVCELIEKTRPRRQPPKDKMYQLRVRLDQDLGVTALSLFNEKEESHFPILTAEGRFDNTHLLRIKLIILKMILQLNLSPIAISFLTSIHPSPMT